MTDDDAGPVAWRYDDLGEPADVEGVLVSHEWAVPVDADNVEPLYAESDLRDVESMEELEALLEGGDE